MAILAAYVEWDDETKLYIGRMPGIRGAHTVATTLDELQHNLKEVLELCIEEGELTPESIPRFAGLQQIEIAI